MTMTLRCSEDEDERGPDCNKWLQELSYNLRSVSSSATVVIKRQTFINEPSSSVKVLMGENPVNDDLPIATTPSKADLETVLDVMNIQMKFWPSLASSYRLLQITLRVGNTEPGEKEACSCSHLVEMGKEEVYVQVTDHLDVSVLFSISLALSDRKNSILSEAFS
ncbi:hypothetical protein DY000_02050045 [Brassica cretica]|uniref:Uncharacterized protein n=1 Tax=Brassica cretica TaxID=69181 RepID=A0ABQ7ERS9_BRACR|nr:hypothetical protein DY000_02050045 [Brassica cretica]